MSLPNDQDPKTLEAIDKIRAILTEYDLWGVIGIGSETRFHWGHHLEPSWSCLHFNPETGECRVRAKVADFATAEQHKVVLDNTVSAIFSTRDYAAMLFSQMDTICEMLKKAMPGITHKSFVDMRFGRPPKK